MGGQAAPKVSVCTRTFNHARYVEQTVEGVLAQEADFPWEFVIADDCSTDGTREILERYRDAHPELIRLILRPRNVGGRFNFIDAHKSCRGEYVAMLDGDDYWTSPHKLARQAAALDEHPEWAMCFHTTRVFHDDGEFEPYHLPAAFTRRVSKLRHLLAANFVPANTVMYRRRLMEPHWSFLLEVPRPGDWCMNILLARQGDVGFLDGVMADHRIHTAASWSKLSYDERASFRISMLRRVSSILEPLDRWRAYRTVLLYRAFLEVRRAKRVLS